MSEKIKVLKEVKQMFEIHSDNSARCNGYNSLCEMIKQLENNESIPPETADDVEKLINDEMHCTVCEWRGKRDLLRIKRANYSNHMEDEVCPRCGEMCEEDTPLSFKKLHITTSTDSAVSQCKLSDEGLCKKGAEWIVKLCESNGGAWSLRSPIDLDNDPDVIFTELIIRYNKQKSNRFSEDWISVKDRLPKIKDNWSDKVLGFDGNKMMVVSLYTGSNKVIGYQTSGEYMHDVTHWMPLPQHPNY